MKGAYVHDLKGESAARTTIEIQPADINNAEQTVLKAAEQISEARFEPSPGDKCRRCDVRSICNSRPK